MDDLTRREALIAAGAVTAGGVIVGSAAASTPPDDSGVNYPRTKNAFKYGLSRSPTKVNNPNGSVRVAGPKEFPVLKNNDAAVGYLILKPGGLREPHWHPTHWEVDYAVQGQGELGVVTPDDQQNIATLSPGDVGFVPQGWAHFIRNVGDVDMIWVLVFNAPLTDIGLSDMFNGMPTSTFQQTLGISFAGAKKQSQTDFIV
jgi:oxalate decarboxylase